MGCWRIPSQPCISFNLVIVLLGIPLMLYIYRERERQGTPWRGHRGDTGLNMQDRHPFTAFLIGLWEEAGERTNTNIGMHANFTQK